MSLSPQDSQYRGHYTGLPAERDGAHQGTAWPWLLGPFITYTKVNEASEAVRTQGGEWLKRQLPN